MIASSTRNIKSGAQYARYFDLSGVNGNEVELLSDGSVEQTIAQMRKIVSNTLAHTHKIAPVLKGNSRMDTARNIWNFVYQHIQYKKDHPLREQLRTPLRTWKDRTSGVDCDCYSIFISSILTNLGIAHAFRIAGYKADYQHVYVIVPTKGSDYSSYITIDCVADRFNYEVPYQKKKDFTVMNTAPSLNGLGQCRTAQPAVVYASEETITKKGYVWTTDVLKDLSVPFTESIGQNNVPSVQFTVGKRTYSLPTTITAAQAAALKSNLTTNAQPDNIISDGLSGFTTSNVLTGLGIGAALWWFFSGGEDKKPALAGVDKTARKMKVVRI